MDFYVQGDLADDCCCFCQNFSDLPICFFYLKHATVRMQKACRANVLNTGCIQKQSCRGQVNIGITGVLSSFRKLDVY